MLKTTYLFRLLRGASKARQQLGVEQSRKRAIRWCIASFGNGK